MNWILGWLSPDGKLYECGYMEHLAVADEICRQLGVDLETVQHKDDYLLEHGWVHLTCTTFFEHKWFVIFPHNTDRLTQAQHDFLKPYVEDNIDWISDLCRTDIKYEFEIDI